MNIANKLTILRILLSFFCMGFILKNTFFSLIIGFILFVTASITDFFDGHLARKYNLVSDLGKLLDPIADKVLIIGVFASFLQLGVITVWMVVSIIFREFLITGLRIFSIKKGVVLEAKQFGKHKTVSQIGVIILIFFTLLVLKIFPENNVINLFYSMIIPVVMWYVVSITVSSGAYYLWANRKVIKTF
ncbi:MAG: CDP-diacylglycerol--glycerol-3-phosphate 3-phosphatidyltransferase [Candidatus Omnitrophota bacterium]